MKLTRQTLLITLNILTLPAGAKEFSAGFLKNSDHSSVDLFTFSRDGYVAPRNYLLDIYLNNRLIRSQYKVSVVETDDGRSRFCITLTLADMLGLKKVFPAVSPVHHQCCLMLFVRKYLCSPHHIRLMR